MYTEREKAIIWVEEGMDIVKKHLKSIFAPAPETSTKWRYYLLTYVGLIFFGICIVMVISVPFAFILKILSEFEATSDSNSASGATKGIEDFSLAVASITATLTALVGTGIALFWSSRQDKRAVIQLTYQFLHEWRSDKISNAIKNYNEHDKKCKEKGESEDDIKSNLYKESMEDLNLRQSIRDLLNYYESLSTALNAGHLDQKIIEGYFSLILLEEYKIYKEYISQSREREKKENREFAGSEVYSDFTDLVLRLFPDLEPVE